MPKKFVCDAVVVGAGPNGLAAAIRMAQAGCSVRVLEANESVGGGTRSAELTLPGFVHDICSAIHPLGLGSPFLRHLPLEKYGLSWIHPEFPLAHPLDDGMVALLQRSVAGTAAGLAVLATIVVISPVLRAINFSLPARSLDMSSLYTWLNLDGLAIGAILAFWLRVPGFSRASLRRVAVPLLALGIVLFAISQRSHFSRAVLSQSWCDLAAAGVLGCAMLLATGPWRRLAANPVLEFLGFISYGLYLVHVLSFAVIDSLFSPKLSSMITILGPTAAMLVRFVLGGGLAIGVAYLSRRSLEEIFLKMNFGPKPAREFRQGSPDIRGLNPNN